LRPVARALIEKAASGDAAAITPLADFLDGTVPQAIGQAEDLGPQRLEISWRAGGRAASGAGGAGDRRGRATTASRRRDQDCADCARPLPRDPQRRAGRRRWFCLNTCRQHEFRNRQAEILLAAGGVTNRPK
jgi:hypothetical protein